MTHEQALEELNHELQELGAAYDHMVTMVARYRAENDALKAMVNELRTTMNNVKHYIADINHGVERTYTAEQQMIWDMENLFFSTTHQALNDHDMRLAERVQDYLSEYVQDVFGLPSQCCELRNLDLSEVIKE